MKMVSKSLAVICDKLGEVGESSDMQEWEKIAFTLPGDVFWPTLIPRKRLYDIP